MAFPLHSVRPEAEVCPVPVERAVFPGTEGDFGVLEGHERFLTPLKIGVVEILQGGQTRKAAVAGGFADVGPERVVALVDTCELGDEIDVARAESARDRARAELDKLAPGEADSEHQYALQEAALQRALVRLQAAGKALR